MAAIFSSLVSVVTLGSASAAATTNTSNSSTSTPSRAHGIATQILNGVFYVSKGSKAVATGVTTGLLKGGELAAKALTIGVIGGSEFAAKCSRGISNTLSNRESTEPLDRVLASTCNSFERLSVVYDERFAHCIHLFVDQVIRLYIQNADVIQKQIKDLLQGVLAEQAGALGALSGGIAWTAHHFMDKHKEWFAQAIKADIFKIIANLADVAFIPTPPCSKLNPIGRLLAVVGACFIQYEERLEEITRLPIAERPDQYRQVFRELSVKLLAKCFPNGVEDVHVLQLNVPREVLIKQSVWDAIHEKLPILLEYLYHETRPLSEKHVNWKENFDQTASGIKVDQLIHLPSDLIQCFIRNDRAQLLNSQTQWITSLLRGMGLDAQTAEELSQLLIKYAKEFLLTENPTLKKMGAFFERYFMERILFNLSEFVPEGMQIPMPQYILQRWIDGDVFKMLCAGLSGTPLRVAKANAILQIFAPFGLCEKVRFPLPTGIKELVWPNIEGFIQDSLPDIILSVIPEWRALVAQKGNRRKIDRQFDDTSLTASISHITSADQTFQLLTSSVSLTNPGLNAQWQALLEQDHSVRILKDFVQECLRAFSMQLCQDLYNHYDKSQMFFDEDDEREYMPPFSVWLFMEMAEACERLSLEGVSKTELDRLQRAIHLKNALRHQKDVEQARQDRAALDALWVTIKPKFDHLARTFFGMCGYRKAEDLPLPLPEGLKTTVWGMLHLQLPYILFEQVGDLMLPLLEKQQLQEQVDALPQGLLIRQGCEHLARDVVKHLPTWLKSTIDALPQKLVDANVGLQLTDRAQSKLTATLKAILNKEDSAYLSFGQWMESYFQGVFLKVAAGMGKMSAPDFQRMHELAHQTKNELLVLKEASVADDDKRVKNTLVKFSENLLALIGIEFPHGLFGLPQTLQEPLLKLMKEEMAHRLLGVYQICHKNVPHPLEHRLPTSEVEKATHALTRYVLDRTTFRLIERDVDGNVKFIDQMYVPFKAWLVEKSQEDYRIATLFQSAIAQQSLTPSLVSLLDLIHSHSCKQEVTDWLNPALANQVIKCFILPLLQKMEAGQATFDQTMLMALVSVFTQHLKHLNVASQSKRELNVKSLRDAAGHELHPDVPLSQEEGEKQKQERFYQGRAKLIFQLIFPNGKKDAEKLLPSFVSDEQWNSLSIWAQECIASLLPNLIEVFFDKEMLTTILSTLLEITIDTLDQPIQMSAVEEAPSHLTEEQQRQVNQTIGQFVIEAAQFIELPAGLVKRLGGESVQEVIGKMVGKQLNGQLFTYAIRQTLSILANKKYVKHTEQELLKGKIEEEKRLQEIEKRLVQRSLAYAFRYVGAYVEHVTDIFKSPVLNFLRKSLLAVTSFIIVNLLGTLLRVFRIEHFVVSRLSKMIRYRTEKTLTVMSQPDLYKNFVYRAIDAFEGVLAN